MMAVIKKVYVAQTFRGDPDCIKKGLKAADHLREIGYEVFSPAEHQVEVDVDPAGEDCTIEQHKVGFKWDMDKVLKSDAVVVLSGLDTSRGVQAEVALARAVDIQVLDYETMEPIATPSLPGPIKEALAKVETIFAKKNADYASGSWRSNFDLVAAQMSVTPVSVVDTMIAVKQARLAALNGRPPENEAVEDTYLDRMVYGVIAYAVLLDQEAP